MTTTMEDSNRLDNQSEATADGNPTANERTDAPDAMTDGANGENHETGEGEKTATGDGAQRGAGTIGTEDTSGTQGTQYRPRRKKKKLNKRIHENDFYGTLHIEPSYPDPNSTYYLDTVRHYLEMDIPEGALFTNDDGTTEPLLPKKAKRWSMGARFENVTPEGCDMVIEKLDDRDWDFPSMDLNTFARDMLEQYVVISGTVYRIGCDKNDNDNVYIRFGKLLYSDEDLSYERMRELGYRQHRDQVMQEIAEGKREPIPEWKYPDLPHVDYREVRRSRRKGRKDSDRDGGNGNGRYGRDRNGRRDDAKGGRWEGRDDRTGSDNRTGDGTDESRSRGGRYGQGRYGRYDDGDGNQGNERYGNRRGGGRYGRDRDDDGYGYGNGRDRRHGAFKDDVDTLRTVPADEIVVNRVGRDGEAVTSDGDTHSDGMHNGVFDPMSLFDPKPDGKFAKCFIEVPRWKFRQYYRPDLYEDEEGQEYEDGTAEDAPNGGSNGDSNVTVEFGSSRNAEDADEPEADAEE